MRESHAMPCASYHRLTCAQLHPTRQNPSRCRTARDLLCHNQRERVTEKKDLQLSVAAWLWVAASVRLVHESFVGAAVRQRGHTEIIRKTITGARTVYGVKKPFFSPEGEEHTSPGQRPGIRKETGV